MRSRGALASAAGRRPPGAACVRSCSRRIRGTAARGAAGAVEEAPPPPHRRRRGRPSKGSSPGDPGAEPPRPEPPHPAPARPRPRSPPAPLLSAAELRAALPLPGEGDLRAFGGAELRPYQQARREAAGQGAQERIPPA
jgi:hypothetical protein